MAAAILDRGSVTECNAAFIRRFGGGRADDLAGAGLIDVVPGSREEQLASIRLYIHSGLTFTGLKAGYRDQEGTTQGVLLDSVGIVERGLLVGAWATCRDITEWGGTGQTLRLARGYVESLMATANAMVIGLDTQGDVQVFNEAARAITGYTREDLKGRNWFEVVVPKDRYPQVWSEFERLTEGGLPVEYENPILTKSGEERYIVWRNSRVVENGDVIGTISVGIDITERKQTEEWLLSLAAAVEQAADDILLLDAEGRIRYVNAAFERTTGYSREEVRGRSPRFLDSGKHPPEFYREIDDAIAAGRTWQGRFSNRTKDGRRILQDASISPIRDTAGRIVGQVSERRDVTRQVEVEEHTAQAYKLQAMGTLAGGIAHDFNNILSAIIGYTQMAQMKCGDNAKLQHDLQAVLQSSRRAADLVKQILLFSRQGKQEAGPVQVGLIVKEAAKLMRASIPATIEIRTLCRSEAVVFADPTEIHRAVVNLCTNAALAMEARGGVLEVVLEDVDLDEDAAARLGGVLPGRFVRLTVSDTGCGMPPEVKERIFEPFYTTREKGQGTGMGLAVVHGVVTSCHGAITVASEPGKGSTFDLYFPAVDRELRTRKSVAEPLPRGAGRILVVDDEPLVATTVTEMLQSLGYEVRTRTNAVEALAAFEADPAAVDVVITDLTMPGMTGDVLAQRLKIRRPDLPVIMCTGYSERITPEAARTLGIDEFVMKPVLMGDLAKIVSKVLVRD
jgi:PAS domain S-box-containing protein